MKLQMRGEYVHFLHKGYCKDSEHLKDRTEVGDLQNYTNIMTLHKDVKSVREIADLVNMSKTTVHRIISQEKKRMTSTPDYSVPSSDMGQAGQMGQSYPLYLDSD